MINYIPKLSKKLIQFVSKFDFYYLILALIIFLFNFFNFVKNDLGGDFTAYFVPHYHFITSSIREGYLPFWFPYNFGGLPELFKSELAIFHPIIFIFLISNTILNLNLEPAFTGNLLEVFMIISQIYAAIGMYILGKNFFLKNKFTSLVISLLYVLGPYSSHLINSTVYLGFATLPWLINSLLTLCHEKTSNRSWVRVLIYNVLTFLSGYPYFYVYFLITQLLIIVIVNYKKIFTFSVSYLLALGLSAFVLMPNIHIYSNSSRDSSITDHQQFALRPTKAIQLLNPLPMGASASIKDPSDLVSYPQLTFGSSFLIFLILGMFAIKNEKKDIFLILNSLFFLIYSFGDYFLSISILSNFIPFIDKFRSHAQGLVPFYLTSVLIIGLGIEKIYKKDENRYLQPTIIICTLIFILTASIFMYFNFSDLEILNGWIRSIILFILSLVVVRMLIQEIKYSYLVLIALVVIEGYLVFNKNSNVADYKYSDFFLKGTLIKEEMFKGDLSRSYFEGNQHAYNTSYLGISQVVGYETVPYKNWYNFFGKYTGLEGYSKFNTRFMVTTSKLINSDPNIELVREIRYNENPNRKIISNKENIPYLTSKSENTHYIYEFKNFTKRFFFPEKVFSCSNKNCILNENFPNIVSFFDNQKMEKHYEKNKEDGIQVLDYKPNEVNLLVNTGTERFVASSEIFDEGWELFINGNKQKLYKTSYGFRGFFVNEGENKIKMSYYPPKFNEGLAVSLTTFIFLVIVVITNMIIVLEKVLLKKFEEIKRLIVSF